MPENSYLFNLKNEQGIEMNKENCHLEQSREVSSNLLRYLHALSSLEALHVLCRLFDKFC